MSQHEASRTLVKSPPELWAECSDASSLARHLDRFGEIRITKLEPETAVAWEGARGSGTVRLEPSGWGTKVVLTAVLEEQQPPEPVVAPEPVAEPLDLPEPVPLTQAARRRRFARLRAFFRGPEPAESPPVTVTAEPELPPAADPAPEPVPGPALDPVPEPAPDPVPEPSRVIADGAEALTAALDSLGQAHHRPFSRA